jgi:hypothetical protein
MKQTELARRHRPPMQMGPGAMVAMLRFGEDGAIVEMRKLGFVGTDPDGTHHFMVIDTDEEFTVNEADLAADNPNPIFIPWVTYVHVGSPMPVVTT